jgi:hypothetical protein
MFIRPNNKPKAAAEDILKPKHAEVAAAQDSHRHTGDSPPVMTEKGA